MLLKLQDLFLSSPLSNGPVRPFVDVLKHEPTVPGYLCLHHLGTQAQHTGPLGWKALGGNGAGAGDREIRNIS